MSAPFDAVALLQKAAQAGKLAYAPYSNYQVGAALLTESGEIFVGCNVENASFGLTICAERTAVFKAVSEGHTQFCALAISASNEAFPCGCCRQVLNEFAPRLPLLIGDKDGNLLHKTQLDILLPNAFGPHNLR